MSSSTTMICFISSSGMPMAFVDRSAALDLFLDLIIEEAFFYLCGGEDTYEDRAEYWHNTRAFRVKDTHA